MALLSFPLCPPYASAAALAGLRRFFARPFPAPRRLSLFLSPRAFCALRLPLASHFPALAAPPAALAAPLLFFSPRFALPLRTPFASSGFFLRPPGPSWATLLPPALPAHSLLLPALLPPFARSFAYTRCVCVFRPLSLAASLPQARPLLPLPPNIPPVSLFPLPVGPFPLGPSVVPVLAYLCPWACPSARQVLRSVALSLSGLPSTSSPSSLLSLFALPAWFPLLSPPALLCPSSRCGYSWLFVWPGRPLLPRPQRPPPPRFYPFTRPPFASSLFFLPPGPPPPLVPPLPLPPRFAPAPPLFPLFPPPRLCAPRSFSFHAAAARARSPVSSCLLVVLRSSPSSGPLSRFPPILPPLLFTARLGFPFRPLALFPCAALVVLLAHCPHSPSCPVPPPLFRAFALPLVLPPGPPAGFPAAAVALLCSPLFRSRFSLCTSFWLVAFVPLLSDPLRFLGLVLTGPLPSAGFLAYSPLGFFPAFPCSSRLRWACLSLLPLLGLSPSLTFRAGACIFPPSLLPRVLSPYTRFSAPPFLLYFASLPPFLSLSPP